MYLFSLKHQYEMIFSGWILSCISNDQICPIQYGEGIDASRALTACFDWLVAVEAGRSPTG